MKLDLSCPIELRGYALSYSDDAVQASVRLYNLTNRRIESFEAVAKWRSSTSNGSVAAPFCAERLRAGGENGFKITLSSSRLPDADRLELIFTSVRFEDGGPDWRAGEGEIVEISPIEPIPSDELAMLKAVAGDDAICYPKQDSQAWRCVCGRVNPNTEDACARCHRDHFTAIGHTRENVRFLYESPKAAPAAANESDAIEELHARYLRQRTRLFRRTIAMALVALALTALLVLSNPPSRAADAAAETASLELRP